MKLYTVRLTPEANEDLIRLYEFLLSTSPEAADYALSAIEAGFDVLRRFPFTCRKAGEGRLGPLCRELIISFGNTGYVALFEIGDSNIVTIAAIRHQRESDYH